MTVFIAMGRPYLRGIRVPRQQKGELARFAHFCEVHLRLEDGRPLLIEDFQKRMLADFFAGTTETVILVPKKNSSPPAPPPSPSFTWSPPPTPSAWSSPPRANRRASSSPRPAGSCAARSGCRRA